MGALPNLKRAIGNKVSTTLSAGVNNTALTMTVADATGMSTSGGYIIIDEADSSKREIVYVESITGNTLTISTSGRGLAGTSASAHDTGATITDVLVDENVNKTIDQFSVGHADDGTHKAGVVTGISLDDSVAGGWISANETWTYASADDPTFTFTISGDKTNKYSAGMRIKLTQTTVKYFIITKVAYSSPSTTITVYGGTDYDLANATITDNYYSPHKSPVGFDANPTKWQVKVTDTTNRTQNSPTQEWWYNLGSISISIPIGLWDIYFRSRPTYGHSTASEVGNREIRVALSTTTNEPSDSELTSIQNLNPVNLFVYTALILKNGLLINSKTTFYAIYYTFGQGNFLELRNQSDPLSISVPLIITATCSYL